MTLPDLLSAAAPTDGGFSVSVGDGWMQGRTIYGGLSAALAHEAARSLAPDLPPLRTAQIAFIGPLSGEVNARSHMLRRGRNAVSIRTELLSDEDVALTAIFTFMAPRDSAVDHERRAMPQVAPPEDCDPARVPPKRTFADRFEWRYALPKQKGEADVSRWVRLKQRGGLDPATEALVVADALPAAALMLFDGFVPLSSVNWHVNMLDGAPENGDGWFFVRSQSDHARCGASNQSMGLWASDGTPVAAAMQSVVLFG